MSDIRAIETSYDGYRFRSRLEAARTARFEHGETPAVRKETRRT